MAADDAADAAARATEAVEKAEKAAEKASAVDESRLIDRGTLFGHARQRRLSGPGGSGGSGRIWCPVVGARIQI